MPSSPNESEDGVSEPNEIHEPTIVKYVRPADKAAAEEIEQRGAILYCDAAQIVAQHMAPERQAAAQKSVDLLGLELFEVAARGTIERLTAELSAAHAHNAALMDMNANDWQCLVEWLKNPDRTPSMFAFTAGIARQAAAAVEQSGILNSVRSNS